MRCSNKSSLTFKRHLKTVGRRCRLAPTVGGCCQRCSHSRLTGASTTDPWLSVTYAPNIPPPFRLSRVISVPSCSTIFATSASSVKTGTAAALCCIQPNGGDVLYCSVSRFFTDNLNRGFLPFHSLSCRGNALACISAPLLDCGFIYSNTCRQLTQSHSSKCVVPHLPAGTISPRGSSCVCARAGCRRLLSLISTQQVQPPSRRE